jgi:hypothetical protein
VRRRLPLPKSVLHVTLDHDCEGAPSSLLGRGIGSDRASFLSLLHCELDVFDLEVGPHDGLLMLGQGHSDAHESAIYSGCDTGLPELRVWGTKRHAVHALLERYQGIRFVGHDLQVVNRHTSIRLLFGA